MLVGHPFDTLKVRLQIEGQQGRFKNPLDCLKKTIKYEGFRGLYKGITLPLLGKGLIHSCIFGVYEQMLGWLEPGHDSDKVALKSVMFAGLTAGWASTVIVTPIDQIKVLLQTQYYPARSRLASHSNVSYYTGPINCAAKLMRTHGFFGMYKQLAPTMLEMSGMSLFFGGCHLTKKILQNIANLYEGNPIVDLLLVQPWLAFLSGASGGIAMQLGVLPMEAVKHRLMNQMRTPHISQQSLQSVPDKYSGILDCIQNMYRTEGIGAFYKGLSPALIRTIPTTGTTFAVFYFVKNFFVPGPKRLCPITE